MHNYCPNQYVPENICLLAELKIQRTVATGNDLIRILIKVQNGTFLMGNFTWLEPRLTPIALHGIGHRV